MIARLNLGGPANQAALLSGRRMDPERFETVLVHGRLARGEESMVELAEAEGATMHHLSSLGQPVDPLADGRALTSLSRIMRAFRPHIVHTHTAKAGFLGRQAALMVPREYRPALVHTFHGHVLEDYFGALKTRLYRMLERSLAGRTDRLIGVSQATVDDLVRLGLAPREKFQVLPLGLDLHRYHDLDPALGPALRAEADISRDAVLAIFVGRVVPIKRLDVMLEALALASRDTPDLRLAIIGDGETRPGLQRHARSLGIAERVHFLGYRSDLRPVFAAADLAVISSDNEGTPVSLIEAGAARVPAVATDVGGVNEVVGTEGGLLVPRGNPTELAAALREMARDAELRRRCGASMRARVTAQYSAERLIEDVRRLYETLASRSS